MNEVKKQLDALRNKLAAVNEFIVQNRDKLVKCIQQMSEALVEAALNPDLGAKTAARVEKLEASRVSTQGEIEKSTLEAAALSIAVEKWERDFGRAHHVGRLDKQTQVQAAYRAVAERLLATANQLAAVSREAADLYASATREFAYQEEHLDIEGTVLRSAGLKPTWDPAWVDRGNGTRRDVVVANIFSFDRALVPATDKVARHKVHEEGVFKARAEEIERERMERNLPQAEANALLRSRARAAGLPVVTVMHPHEALRRGIA